MRNVHIMQGVSGSGKTTYAGRNMPDAKVVSADHYFMQKGKYVFNASRLKEAHATCLLNFITFVRDGLKEIVVDNTNSTVAEIAPYYAIAEAHGYTVGVCTLVCDPRHAYERSKHGVPLSSIESMADRIRRMEPPPWWNQNFIQMMPQEEHPEMLRNPDWR